MKNNNYDIAIIGGGISGITAAFEANKLGLKTILFEKDSLGGLTFNGGDIILSSLYEALESYLKLVELKNIDSNIAIPKKERQYSIDFEKIAKNIIKRKSFYLEEYTSFLKSSNNVDLVFAEASVLNKNTILANNYKYYSKNIILAYGGMVNIPEVKDIYEAYHSNYLIKPNQILNLKNNLKKIIFYGAGKVAFELAIFFSNLNIHSYIIAREDFLNHLDSDVKNYYLDLIKNDYIHFINYAVIKEFRSNSIVYQKDNVEYTLSSDVVILATGAIPNLEPVKLLNLEVDHKGIIINDYTQTNIENIYAIGDINNKEKYSNLAILEAITAIKHITNQLIPLSLDNHIKKTIGLVEYSYYGKNEKELINEGFSYYKKVITFDQKNYRIYYLKLLIDKKTRKTLGIILIGKNTSSYLNNIISLLEGDYLYSYNHKNHLFSHDYQISRNVSRVLEEIDYTIIEESLETHYQIKVDKQNKIIGCEALTRFNVNNSLVNPLPIITSFEKNNTIVHLDLKTIENACKLIYELKAQKLIEKDFRISINISPVTLNLIDSKKIIEIIRKYSVVANQITFELTERDLEVKPIAQNKLALLKKMGFKLSMDDFSIGNSSLNLLNKVSFDEIKLDMSLLPININDINKMKIFDNILEIINSKSKLIIVEGVETEDQLVFLKDKLVDGYQGYLFSKPLNKLDFIDLLKTYHN